MVWAPPNRPCGVHIINKKVTKGAVIEWKTEGDGYKETNGPRGRGKEEKTTKDTKDTKKRDDW
jgi:hypothetical protein